MHVSRGGGRSGKAGVGGDGAYVPAVAALPPPPSGRVFAGLEASTQEVVELLTGGSDPPQVVTIVGPPGQGGRTVTPCTAISAMLHLTQAPVTRSCEL